MSGISLQYQTILTAEVSLVARRRSALTQASPPLHKTNKTLIEHVTSAANLNLSIIKVHHGTDISQTSYEDKIACTKFTIGCNEATNADTRKALLESFGTFLEQKNGRRGLYFRLRILPEEIPRGLKEYFEGVDVETFMLGYMSDPATFHAHFDYSDDLKGRIAQPPLLTIEIDREKSYVVFAVSEGLPYTKEPDPNKKTATTEVYKLLVNHKHLAKRIIVGTNTQFLDICMLSRMPIQLWRTLWDINGINNIKENTKWVRASKITSKSYDAMQEAFHTSTLGGCNVLLLRLARNQLAEDILTSLAVEGDFHIQHTVLSVKDGEQLPQELPIITDGRGNYVDNLSWMVAAINSIGFRIKCQLWDADVQRSYINQIYHNQYDTNDLMYALCRTYDVLLEDADGFLHVDRVLEHFIGRSTDYEEPVVRGNRRLVKRMVITPSRILLQPPMYTHDNRILREFDPNSCALCKFMNDDTSGFATVECDDQFVKEVIGEVLRSGVEAGGRHYRFLGCSGSQLKNNGCWMYAQDEDGYTADNIRVWMGQLEEIRNPGAYLARMGQCFSDTSAPVIQDPEIEITLEGDIEGGTRSDGKPYCFSDGIGRISKECLSSVFASLPEQVQRLPSAFQVRLGGNKGMLALDNTLTGKKIILRLSMYKFSSGHETVEVMKRTQPTPLYLNRQVITILSQLRGGIPDHVFMKFLYNMLHRMADVFLDDRKAIDALNSCGFPCCYGKLAKHGFSFTQDPFFKGMLKAVTCSKISQLRKKARIEIPPEYGRAMLGVLDEAGVLNYGEVFIQYSMDMTQTQPDTLIVEGTVVVSKMPCLHPGDVRKFKAVMKPELKHLVDCIVFPQKGKRPHPDEMANSDLDGDEYFVTWHPDLIFQGPNAEPMAFISDKKMQMDRPIVIEDLIEFIEKSVSNDKVGTISLAHLATADKDDIYSNKSLKLAEIFCRVIDFPKTGHLPTEIEGKGICAFLPNEYPHFMDKKDHKPTYKSDKILGKLYEDSRRIEEAVRIIDKEDTDRLGASNTRKINPRLKLLGHEIFLEAAEKLYHKYADHLEELQTKYGIDSEEELVSGCVTKVNDLYATTADDLYDISQTLRYRIIDIVKAVQEKFEHLIGTVEAGGSLGAKQRKFASACYVFTYTNKKKFQSFPWVFSEHLLGILQRKEYEKESLMDALSASIDAIEADEVTHIRRKFGIKKKWGCIIMNKIEYLLLQWGEKAKFLQEEGTNDQLTPMEFREVLLKVYIINQLEFQTQKNSAALLIFTMEALTNLPDTVQLSQSTPNQEAIINMKRQMLRGHHQLARDPRIDSLMVFKENMKTVQLHIKRDDWTEIKPHTGHLSKIFWDSRTVDVRFRRKERREGLMTVKGYEKAVFEFEAYWFEDGPIRSLNMIPERAQDTNALQNSVERRKNRAKGGTNNRKKGS